MASLDKSLEILISRLARNKKIPKYQFERSSEAFLSIFIEEALSKKLDIGFEYVVPEFPLKKSDNSQSTNADYLFKSSGNEWLLVEIKTEITAIRKNQLEVYEEIQDSEFAELISKIEAILENTKKKSKYEHLLTEIKNYHPLTGKTRIIYITPHKNCPFQKDVAGIDWISFKDLFFDFKSEKHPDLWPYVSELIQLL